MSAPDEQAPPPGHVRIRHPRPDVADAVVPESAVPIHRGSGWELVDVDGPAVVAVVGVVEESVTFAGPPPPGHVRIRHPRPDVADAVVPESAVPIHRGSGWELVDVDEAALVAGADTGDAGQEPAPAVDQGPPPVPAADHDAAPTTRARRRATAEEKD